MILYDHPASGNCMKARILLGQLGLPYERVTVDLFKGETRSAEHFGRNPDGRIPVLELDSGETIAESGAILLHLAEARRTSPPAALRAHACTSGCSSSRIGWRRSWATRASFACLVATSS